MKSKKALIGLLATALLAALFSASSVTANAADNSNSTAVAKFDKVITMKNVPRLSKWGYIVTVNSDSQPIQWVKIVIKNTIRKNEYDFNLAVKAAKKLKGQQRKFVLASLKQAKKDGYITKLTLPLVFNILLWGIDQ